MLHAELTMRAFTILLLALAAAQGSAHTLFSRLFVDGIDQASRCAQ